MGTTSTCMCKSTAQKVTVALIAASTVTVVTITAIVTALLIAGLSVGISAGNVALGILGTGASVVAAIPSACARHMLIALVSRLVAAVTSSDIVTVVVAASVSALLIAGLTVGIYAWDVALNVLSSVAAAVPRVTSVV